VDKCVAERVLLYSVHGESDRKNLHIRIGQPCIVPPGSVSFDISEGTAVCRVEYIGLDEEVVENYYGADLLHALQLAVCVDPVLNRLSKKYDFYFIDGEPYFSV